MHPARQYHEKHLTWMFRRNTATFFTFASIQKDTINVILQLRPLWTAKFQLPLKWQGSKTSLRQNNCCWLENIKSVISLPYRVTMLYANYSHKLYFAISLSGFNAEKKCIKKLLFFYICMVTLELLNICQTNLCHNILHQSTLEPQGIWTLPTSKF